MKNNQKITIVNNTIEKIEPLDTVGFFDYENLAPALIDLHINGGEELHFTQSPTMETISDIENAAKKNGVGYVLPTLITSSIDNIFRGLDAIKNYCASNPNAGVLGMHLEGPFISVKKRGAHLEKYIIKPDEKLLREILEFGGTYLKMITIAPEVFTKTLLQILLDSEVAVSAGHSNCDYTQAETSFNQGVRVVTHLFNAMSAFGHREPGLAGASLLMDDVHAPIILDNVHVSKNAAKLAYKLKKEKLFLISDALFQNHKKKEFKWEEFEATLKNGNYINTDGNLAGATISMADAVKNAKDWFEIDNLSAINMGTYIPSKIIKSERKIGQILKGHEAKFCTFDNEMQNFKSIS